MAVEKRQRIRGRCGVGLDLSGEGMQAVCVTRSADGAAVALAPDEVAALLRDNPRCVAAAAMPLNRSLCVTLELPFDDARRARRVLPSLLDIQLPFALEEAATCFPAVLDPGRSALAVVARHTDVTACLAPLAAKQVDPQILDHEGVALWAGGLRWFAQTHGGVPEALLVVCITAGRVVLVHGKGGHYRTALECGGDDLLTLKRLLATLLGPRAANPAGSPGQILLCGAGLDEAAGAIGVIEQWGLPLTRAAEAGRFLAETLARRALLRENQPYPCNLRTAAHAHRGLARRERRALLVAASVCWMMAGLLLGGSLMTGLWLGGRDAALARQLEVELDRTAGFNISAKGAAARQQAMTAVAEERTRYAAVSRQFEAGPQRYFWQVLAEAQRAGVVVAAYSFGGDGAVRLEGRLGEGGDLTGFEQWLQASGWSVSLAGAQLPAVRLVATPLPAEGARP